MQQEWFDTASTESEPELDHLEQMSSRSLLEGINKQDRKVAGAVRKAIPQLEKLVDATAAKMKAGGKLLYIGAGTSGRLGIVDAAECPPTFGVTHWSVIGIIAGGDGAIRRAVERAEDDKKAGAGDLYARGLSRGDVVIGISASGRTPYVLEALRWCNEAEILTGCIVCNRRSAIAHEAKYPVEILTGPEFIAGSTRMKAGLATSMALKMLSTSVMIKLGHVLGNKMVDMNMSTDKLVERGVRMLVRETGADEKVARALLKEHRSVRAAMTAFRQTK